MNLSQHTIDHLPAMGEGAVVRVNVADWLVAVVALKAAAKATRHGRCTPGMKGVLPLEH